MERLTGELDAVKEELGIEDTDFSYTISRVDDAVIVHQSRELLPIDIVEILTNIFLMVPTDLRSDIFEIVQQSIEELDITQNKIALQ